MGIKLKVIAIIAVAVPVVALVLFGTMLRAENREAYWQWYIENNVAILSVSGFTLFIVWLIFREIRNKPDS